MKNVAAKAGAPARNSTQGAKWIRREKRLAIYLRDGLACAYCGVGIEDGAILTLDHLTPNAKGGSNASDNLVTCCHRCNSARGTRPVRTFTRAVADYLNHGIKAEDIEGHVRNCVRRTLDIPAAKKLIAARGWAEALHG